MTRLLLVRHGQSTSNVSRLMDTALPGAALTELGHQQARELVDRLAGEDIAAVHCSAAVRAQQTAGPLAQARALTPVLHRDLREVQSGDWEMSAATEALQGYVDTIGSWLTGDLDRRMPGPAGESGREVLERMDRMVSLAVADGARPEATAGATGGAVVIVAHGALIRFWAGLRVPSLGGRFVADHPLPNAGMLVLQGDVDSGWVCTGWTGAELPVAAAPDAAPDAADAEIPLPT